MTAVVAILNKRGLAIAADSAVTRSKGYDGKITKNGNKMVRLSDVVPISVMLTGNGAYMHTQWDILVRYYRQHRGDVRHETVEACVQDFFQFIADHHLFCDKLIVKQFIFSELEDMFNPIVSNLCFDYDLFEEKEVDADELVNGIKTELDNKKKTWLKEGVCPQFKDYSLEQFHRFAGYLVDGYFQREVTCLSKTIVDAIREDVELALMTRLSTRRYKEIGSSQLVFTGYGDKQMFPSLVAVTVYEGFDDRVNYHYRQEDVVNISDDCPAAICSFAQDDIIQSLLCGLHSKFFDGLMGEMCDLFSAYDSQIGSIEEKETDGLDTNSLSSRLHKVKSMDLMRRCEKACGRHMEANRRKWEKALQDYDLSSMAALAESLIELTGFHRIITFSDEGVGGPVDLAIVSKADGFVWLNRKSWYHHKDVGGKYGKFGV